MYVVIVGAGKVGWNLARELINKRHEVTVVESDARRYSVVEQELEHSAMYGDGSELWVLERAGIERTDLILRLIEHEVPKYGLVHLLDLPEERLEIIELEVGDGSPAAGRAVKDLG